MTTRASDPISGAPEGQPGAETTLDDNEELSWIDVMSTLPRHPLCTPPAAPQEALVAALETAVDMGDHFRLRSDQYEIAYRAALQRPAAPERILACPACQEEGGVHLHCTLCGEDYYDGELSMAHSRRYARENPNADARHRERTGRGLGECLRPAAQAMTPDAFEAGRMADWVEHFTEQGEGCDLSEEARDELRRVERLLRAAVPSGAMTSEPPASTAPETTGDDR